MVSSGVSKTLFGTTAFSLFCALLLTGCFIRSEREASAAVTVDKNGRNRISSLRLFVRDHLPISPEGVAAQRTYTIDLLINEGIYIYEDSSTPQKVLLPYDFSHDGKKYNISSEVGYVEFLKGQNISVRLWCPDVDGIRPNGESYFNGRYHYSVRTVPECSAQQSAPPAAPTLPSKPSSSPPSP